MTEPNCNQKLTHSLIFPSHLYRLESWSRKWSPVYSIRSWLLKNLTVRAAETNSSVKDQDVLSDQQHALSIPAVSPELELLARAYIQHETGKERVKMIFKKDHMGKSSPEMEYIQVVLAQTFVISFFMKYVPEFYFAKQDFIREHHGTVFRTRLEAVRRMQDHVSLTAATAGGRFAVKITAFACGFAFISQMIASYRNKTSVLEYSVAAGITGGVARLQLGIKGFIAGCFLGTVLGSIVGCVACALFRVHDATQEQRHLYYIIKLLEVQKYVEGEHTFKKKLEEVKKTQLNDALPSA